MRPGTVILRASVALAMGAPGALALEAAPLFNGRDLSGWVHEGPRPTFAAHDGELRTSGAGNFPNWLRTRREYENFRLRFEYKLAQWAEAAVYLRAPRRGRPGDSGLAVVLAHDFHGRRDSEYITGAVRGVLKPLRPAAGSFGDWHTVDIVLDGGRLRVRIDDAEVQNVGLASHPELRYRLRRGYIGFPDLGHAYAVRNIHLEDRGGRTRFIELFDGLSIDGWQLEGGGNWVVQDGAIHASNGHGLLFAPGEFLDHELTLLVRTRGHPNGGVRLRSAPGERSQGFEVQIYSPPDAVFPTGSIYNHVRSRLGWDHEGEWILMQVFVAGRHCLVRINGETVAEMRALPEAASKPGRIALQMHSENSSIEFRDICVRPLPEGAFADN